MNDWRECWLPNSYVPLMAQHRMVCIPNCWNCCQPMPSPPNCWMHSRHRWVLHPLCWRWDCQIQRWSLAWFCPASLLHVADQWDQYQSLSFPHRPLASPFRPISFVLEAARTLPKVHPSLPHHPSPHPNDSDPRFRASKSPANPSDRSPRSGLPRFDSPRSSDTASVGLADPPPSLTTLPCRRPWFPSERSSSTMLSLSGIPSTERAAEKYISLSCRRNARLAFFCRKQTGIAKRLFTLLLAQVSNWRAGEKDRMPDRIRHSVANGEARECLTQGSLPDCCWLIHCNLIT